MKQILNFIDGEFVAGLQGRTFDKRSPVTNQVIASVAEAGKPDVDRAVAAGKSAIRAFTSVEQIAWAVTTLLAPEADAFAGSTLFMDAGRRRGLP